MINVKFKPNFFNYTAVQKRDEEKSNLKLKTSLGIDSVSFTRRAPTTGIISEVEYVNVLKKPLVSVQSPTFYDDLSKVRGLSDRNLAKKRIASLSKYLKENMVGFVVPRYTVDGKEKGGYQWFERGAENLLKGSREGVGPAQYKAIAKELYGTLAVHDKYWKSPEFIDYLSSLKPSPAIKATIAGVKELNEKDVPFKGQKVMTTYGYFSPLKAIDKLIFGRCAYTGNTFRPQDKLGRPSLDHIVPKSWGGADDDANYILATSDENSKRGNIGLIEFIKGANDTNP